jgi:cobalt/nickel transport system permease protein
MHLAEGVLSARESVGWSIVVLPWVLRGWKQHRVALDLSCVRERAAEALAGVLLFACSSMPIPLPFLGFSIHFCLTPLLALFFGLQRIPFYVAIFLLIQAVCMGHGGLSTWGINVFSLGVLGPLVAAGLGRSYKHPLWIGLSCGIAVGFIYLFDAVILSAEMHSIQSFECWQWVAGVFAVLLPLVLLEGVLSGFLWARLIVWREQNIAPTLRKTKSVYGYLDWGLVGFAICLAFVASQGRSLPDVDDFLVEHAKVFKEDFAVVGVWFLMGLMIGFGALLKQRRSS